MKTKAGQVHFKRAAFDYGVLDIPAGLRVQLLESPTHSFYVLDEFPVQIFARDSFIYHDAVHYGVIIPNNMVEKD